MTDKNLETFLYDLNKSISEKYPLVKDVFNAEYGYTQIDPIRSEICKCIICGLPQASITLTNYLMESSLKMALIIKYSVEHPSKSNDLREVFSEGVDKYADNDLQKTINQACSNGLITKEQKKKLSSFRENMRNPYSHANTKKILSGRKIRAKTIKYEPGDDPIKMFESMFNENDYSIINVDEAYISHGIMMGVFAENNHIEYFKEVDALIREMVAKIPSRSS